MRGVMMKTRDAMNFPVFTVRPDASVVDVRTDLYERQHLAHERWINSAAFAPTIIAGALVLPEGTVGKIEASATRKPSTP